MTRHARLLIVDDEEHMRRGLSELFPWRDWGIEIAAALENGVQALDFLREHSADIVLADINMPQMDGLALARELQQHYPEVRVVLLSAYAEFEYARQAIRCGVSEYLVKPVSYRQLEETFSLQPEADDDAPYEGYYSEIVRRVKQHLEEHPDTATLESAAALLGLSAGHLSRIFHRHAGMTFSACLYSCRMQLAARLLAEDIAIDAAAYRCGYDNTAGFAAAFRRYHGESPAAYQTEKGTAP